MNAVTFLKSGLLATAAGKSVALWDVDACTMKQTLQHEGAVSHACSAHHATRPRTGTRAPARQRPSRPATTRPRSLLSAPALRASRLSPRALALTSPLELHGR